MEPILASSTRPLSCPLELLNDDILIAVMSAIGSISDLNALIHASPKAYKCFSLYKRNILLSIVSATLGPALKDAHVLSTMIRVDWKSSNWVEQCEDSIQQYKDILSTPNFTRGIRAETVVRIVKIDRVTQYFVDLFASMRFEALQESCGISLLPLSTEERHRLAQAFTRFQILTHLFPLDTIYREKQKRGSRMSRKFAGLLEPFEMEQLSVASAFVNSLFACLSVFDRSVKHAPGPFGTEKRFESDLERYQTLRGAYFFDLDAFRRKLQAAFRIDKELRGNIMSRMRKKAQAVNRTYFSFLYGTYKMPDFRAEELTEEEDERVLQGTRRNVDGAARKAPYAWIDAFDGCIWSRWDASFRKEIENSYVSYARKGNLIDWRWAGFMFWDEDRVELLKSKGYNRLRSGWLFDAL